MSPPQDPRAELSPSALAQPPHGRPTDLRGERRGRGVPADQGCGRGLEFGGGGCEEMLGTGVSCSVPPLYAEHSEGAAPAGAPGRQNGHGSPGEGRAQGAHAPSPAPPAPPSSRLAPSPDSQQLQLRLPHAPRPPRPPRPSRPEGTRRGGAPGGIRGGGSGTRWEGPCGPSGCADPFLLRVCILAAGSALWDGSAAPWQWGGGAHGTQALISLRTGRKRRPGVPRRQRPAGAFWGEREDGQPRAAGSPGTPGPPWSSGTTGATGTTRCLGSQEPPCLRCPPQGIRERGEGWGWGCWGGGRGG